jgi:hypothetical protein
MSIVVESQGIEATLLLVLYGAESEAKCSSRSMNRVRNIGRFGIEAIGAQSNRRLFVVV